MFFVFSAGSRRAASIFVLPLPAGCLLLLASWKLLSVPRVPPFAAWLLFAGLREAVPAAFQCLAPSAGDPLSLPAVAVGRGTALLRPLAVFPGIRRGRGKWS